KRQPATTNDRQRPHGIMEQVHEVGHVPPSPFHQRSHPAVCHPQLRRLLQPLPPAFGFGVSFPGRVRNTIIRLGGVHFCVGTLLSSRYAGCQPVTSSVSRQGGSSLRFAGKI